MVCGDGYQEINGICQLMLFGGLQMTPTKWFYLATLFVEGGFCAMMLNTLEKKLGFK